MRVALIISFLLALYTAQVCADITIRYDLINNNQKVPAHLVMIKQELVRIDNRLGQHPDLMINLATGDIIQLQEKDREYFRINAQTLNQYVDLYRQNSGFMQSLITQGIQHLEPEKRAQIEQMLKKFDQRPSAQNTISLQKTTLTDRVLGVQCQIYSVMDRGLRVRDLCLGEYQQLGLEVDEIKSFELLKKMLHQFKQQAPDQQDLLSIMAKGIEHLNGVPLKVVEYYANGQIRNIIQAGSISLQKVPAVAYQIPQHFTERLTPIL